VAHRDEEAFVELVRRLGPTVFGACRSVLGSPKDAEDAFQVTFNDAYPQGRYGFVRWAMWPHGCMK